MSGKRALYDVDDFYDEDDADEDYYGEYGEFDAGESQLVGRQSNKTPAKVALIQIQRSPFAKLTHSHSGHACRLSTNTRLGTKHRLGHSVKLRQQLLQVLLPWLARFSVASPLGVVRLFCSLCLLLC